MKINLGTTGKNKHSGFTLMELMVTVAIVGILAGIALPSYYEYMLKSYRTEVGTDELGPILSAQEEFRRDTLTYTTNLTDLGLPSNPYTTPNQRFRISARQCVLNGNAMPLTQCVEIEATALGDQRDDGDVIFNTLGTRNHRLKDGTLEEF